jgi:small-conductance mechanosensitive channel
MFAGIYIKVRKPFKLEDRIEINEVKGDVVVINALSFKILEIGDRINGEQSSGIIVNIPNSFIFSYALKNYTTAFKYIWDEIVVKIPLKSDVNKIKEELLSIVNNNEIVEAIPRKMDKAVKESSLEYRIYYNHLDPIIYTKVVDDHIELDIRFLVHPKKIRTVENDVWLEILKKYDEKKIDLFFNNN